MNKIDEYLKKQYKLEIIPDLDEGGYVACYPELKGCISCGETLEDAVEHVKEAKRDWILAALKDGYPIPEPGEETYSGQFKLRVPKSLHRALAQDAKREGISMNQYCVYLLAKSEGISC